MKLKRLGIELLFFLGACLLVYSIGVYYDEEPTWILKAYKNFLIMSFLFYACSVAFRLIVVAAKYASNKDYK